MPGPRDAADVGETAQLFERIRAAHPGLHMVLDADPRDVDVELTIPEQEAVAFPIRLNRQGDELHLEAGDHFALEWFPARDRDVADRYFDAVDGLLAGRCRIVEHYRGRRAVRAELEALRGGDWRVLGTWSRARFPVPWRTTRRVLTNRER
jgi:hypothetical protein